MNSCLPFPLCPPNPPMMWPQGNSWSNDSYIGSVSTRSACSIWCDQGSILTDHHGWRERGKVGYRGGKVRRVTCWRLSVTHGRASSPYIPREEKSEEYPTSGNYSPVCWLMTAVMRWSRASLLPAVLLLVRNGIYLSCFHFYTMCNLGVKEIEKVPLR